MAAGAAFSLMKINHSKKTVEAKGYGVQVAAMTRYDLALDMVNQLQTQNKINDVLITNASAATNDLYKVYIGPFNDLKAAKAYRAQCLLYKVDCFVVDLFTLLPVIEAPKNANIAAESRHP